MKADTLSQDMYLMTIYNLHRRNNCVRAVDVAEKLGYSKPSVTNALKRLINCGYIEGNIQNGIVLTQDGYNKARKIYEHYTVIEQGLERMGVPEDAAKATACNLVYIISDEVYQILIEKLAASCLTDNKAQIDIERCEDSGETLTASDFKYLTSIADSKENVKIKYASIADNAGVSNASVSKAMQRLERKGFIVKDGKKVVMTETGKKLFDEYCLIIGFMSRHLAFHCGTAEEIVYIDAVNAVCQLSESSRRGMVEFLKNLSDKHKMH